MFILFCKIKFVFLLRILIELYLDLNVGRWNSLRVIVKLMKKVFFYFVFNILIFCRDDVNIRFYNIIFLRNEVLLEFE